MNDIKLLTIIAINNVTLRLISINYLESKKHPNQTTAACLFFKKADISLNQDSSNQEMSIDSSESEQSSNSKQTTSSVSFSKQDASQVEAAATPASIIIKDKTNTIVPGS